MKKITVFFVLVSFLGTLLIPIASAEEIIINPSPVYALWNKTYSYRYLTISETEKNNLLKDSVKWKDEGSPWQAYATQKNGTVPIYKIKNKKQGYYYYLTSEAEKNNFVKSKKSRKTWQYDGIAFYVFGKNQDGATPIYATEQSGTKKYFYTSSLGEKNCILTDANWTYRGEIFWVPKEKANVSTDNSTCRLAYGPEISVGLWSYTKNDLKEESFKIDSNKDYIITDKNGNKIAEVLANTTTKVKYDGDEKLRIYNSIASKIMDKEVGFEAKDGDNFNLIFNLHRPNSSYNEYRGKIKLKYNNTSKEIWVINTLPIEQYTWGMGETTGTGPFEHTKVMTVIFRTYGYWYNKYATKYLKYGFTIKSDSGSQIYRGYEWEKKYPNIKEATNQTRGVIVKYKDEIALTPYSSWSDGKTRSFEERWGSDDYPWCKSVKDPYGKHSTMNTKQLEAAGNHMVGLVANGSLKLAGSKYKKKYDAILKYYYSKISLSKMY
ncbi:MAG TPA: SpoIID/LytB domain-containing protein [Candidatus Moranbacteria bacterium]|nr:SpoIID/LytB domain-containing protein [Candidatus Moranbacteria bacterium]